MFCDITDLAFPNYICMQEVLPDFTDAIQHHKVFYSSDFKETKKRKEKMSITTGLSITSLQ